MPANAPPEGLIHIDVTAADRVGRPFSGLAAKDFRLLDNGVAQKIATTMKKYVADSGFTLLFDASFTLDDVRAENGDLRPRASRGAAPSITAPAPNRPSASRRVRGSSSRALSIG